MAAAVTVHAALVLPFLTRSETPIQIHQPELSVTIAPPSREAEPDAAGFQSLANRQGAGDNTRIERIRTAKLGMAADAPTDPTTQQGQGQGSDTTHQASAVHKQGEQQRSATPGRVVLNQKATTQTRGNASDVLLAELDFNKIQLSGQGEGEGQAAIELLKRASPFDPFPNALVAYQTELTITRIWQFNQGQHTLR